MAQKELHPIYIRTGSRTDAQDFVPARTQLDGILSKRFGSRMPKNPRVFVEFMGGGQVDTSEFVSICEILTDHPCPEDAPGKVWMPSKARSRIQQAILDEWLHKLESAHWVVNPPIEKES
jgi:hypothetical protein